MLRRRRRLGRGEPQHDWCRFCESTKPTGENTTAQYRGTVVMARRRDLECRMNVCGHAPPHQAVNRIVFAAPHESGCGPNRKCSRSAPTSACEGKRKDLLTSSCSLRDPERSFCTAIHPLRCGHLVCCHDRDMLPGSAARELAL